MLIATDIASRGIDVTDITLVINYDLPDDASDYVHRIGRTGRAGREGRAISFATPSQAGSIRDIEKLIRSPLRRTQHASLPIISMDQNSSALKGTRHFSPRNKSRQNFKKRRRRN